MSIIFKEFLDFYDRQTIHIPEDSDILCVQVQNDTPCLWYKYSGEANRLDKEILIVRTGQSFNCENTKYIDTFQLEDGLLEYHVFEVLS